MPVSITITGLDNVRTVLGRNFQPTLRNATRAITEEVRRVMTPYPPATIANSPATAYGRWYQRGYGARWRLQDGSIRGRATSQMLNRSWGIRPVGAMGHVLGSRTTYAPFLHDAQRQARWAGQRGWITDEAAIRRVVQSGAVERIIRQAVIGALTRR